MRTPPLAYLITFHTYGTWLHGDARGSIDRRHCAFMSPMRPPGAGLQSAMQQKLSQPPVVLTTERRAAVEKSLHGVCEHHGWALHALAVRTEHVHIVLEAHVGVTPERALNMMKSWATRRMVELGTLPAGTRAWSRHGSTRHLWTEEAIAAASRYVTEGQGAPLP